MKMRKCLSVLFALAILLGSMPVLAAETGAGESKLPDGIISMDLTERVPVSEIPQQTAVTREVVSKESVNRASAPNLVIFSIIARPYAIEKATGELYYFPNIKVGHEMAATDPYVNNLVVNFTEADAFYLESVLDENGFDLCRWEYTMEYGLNTIYIPKFLDFTVNGIQKPILQLDSSDKGRPLYYVYNIDCQPGEPYEGFLMEGELVCMNIDTSAVQFPFRCGIRFIR